MPRYPDGKQQRAEQNNAAGPGETVLAADIEVVHGSVMRIGFHFSTPDRE